MLCGYVTVPERHARPDGPSVRLAVAEFPRESSAADRDPIVLLAGGPGESTFEAFVPGMDSAVGRRLRRAHDVVLIELRGLLYSQPNLICPERFDAQETRLAEDPNSSEAIAGDLNAIRACHDRLVGQRIDLAAFNNLESAADIVEVMTRLGYERFELYGNSAGTLLAQHVMRAYPQRLKAVALGSVIPVAISPWPDMPANGTRALRRVFECCRADRFCSRAFPALEADFIALIDRLDQQPILLRLDDPVRKTRFELLLTGDRAAQWIYELLLMDANAGPSIPFLIERLVVGDYRALQFGMGSFLPARSFSQGLQYSVACAEQADYAPAEIDVGGPYPAFAKGIARLPFGPERLLSACRIWNVPALEPPGESVAGGVPTLLLAGDFDPAIPPDYPKRVARTLTAARLFAFPGVAHTPIDGGACPMSIVSAFIDDPTHEIDGACMSDMKVRFVSEPFAERFLWPWIPSVVTLAACLLAMVSMPIVWVIAARHTGRSPNETSRDVRLAEWGAGIAGGLNLMFVLTVLCIGPTQIIYGFPIVVRLAMVLPLLSLLPVAAALWFTLKAWKRHAGRIAQRLQCSVFLLVLIVWIWQLHYWHLLDWRM